MKRFLSLILCITLFCGILPTTSLAARDLTYEESLANDLKSLGIFQGVSLTDFDLDRAPTRIEAIVMLIRMLGKEQVALSGSWSHPFTDVPAWANQYVGYAYTEGLANGVALDKFGTGAASSAMYLTFVLRALGYSDMGGADFVWDAPYELATQAGLLSSRVNTTNFWRADVVLVSHAALPAFLKNSSQTLADKLISEGVFSREAFDTCFNKTSSNDPTSTPQTPPPAAGGGETTNYLTSEEIYEQCSPAVFYIEVYNEKNQKFGNGSGFFIESSGVAVTNYHVIEDAAAAKITLSTTGKTYDVKGVYGFSIENDWAILQIDGSGFPTLKIGDSWSISGGATVYAIGSPLGLQNSISEGLISNTNRVLDGTTYLQISAPISSGSSGGALINAYGEVIGITSAGFVDGQNLNLALPISVIAGYSTSNLTKFSKTGTVEEGAYNSPDKRVNAYSYLRSWVKANTNNNFDGDPAYSETFTDDSSDSYTTYALIYNQSDEQITVMCEYMPPDSAYSHTSMITLSPYEPKTFFYYDYSMMGMSRLIAYGYMNPASISENAYFEFPKYEAASYYADYYLETCRAGAKATCISALDFANYIFSSYLKIYGSFSVADFGFTGI